MKKHLLSTHSGIFIFSLWMLIALLSPFVSTSQTIELLGAAGSGGPSGNGPVTADQTVTLYTNATTATNPPVIVTYRLSNQQFSSIEGNAGVPGALFGSGSTSGSGLNSPPASLPLYALMNATGGSSNANYTACNSCTPGTGIDINSNQSVRLMMFTDALITSAGAQLAAYNARVHYADLTLIFNRPVSNPVLHFTGLGGRNSYSSGGGSVHYDLGYASDFDLITPGLSFSRLSGSTYFDVTSTSIRNSSTYIGANVAVSVVNGLSRYGASGSAAVIGTNITSITLRLYIRGDGGAVRDDSGNPTSPENGNIIRWALHGGFIPNGGSSVLQSMNGDQSVLGLSLQRPVTLSGNVFNDPNAGNVNNSTSTTNAIPAGIYANLIDGSGKVVASTPVSTGGAYSFPSVFEGSYTINISSTAGTQGITAPAANTPEGWFATGEFIGAPNTGNDGNINGTSNTFIVTTADVSNINFAIQQAPESAFNLQPAAANPGSVNNISVPANAFLLNNVGATPNTLDYDGGTVNSIRITAFPSNANSITINGTVYTNGGICPPATTCTAWPVGGVPVAYTNGTGISVPVLVDPLGGNVDVIIPYVAIDNAGREDATPGSVTLPLTGVLAIGNIELTGKYINGLAELKWYVTGAADALYYIVERSTNGVSFDKVAELAAIGNIDEYAYTDNSISNPAVYYRIKAADRNGTFKYSNIFHLAVAGNGFSINVWPSPFNAYLNINLKATQSSTAMFRLISIEGKEVFAKSSNLQYGWNYIHLDMPLLLPAGVYILEINTPDKKTVTKLLRY